MTLTLNGNMEFGVLYLQRITFLTQFFNYYPFAWSLTFLRQQWLRVVLKVAPFKREANAVILVGDGVKQAKEVCYMPGVKKLYQKSEDVSKSTFIFGHLWGSVGIPRGNAGKMFCLPLSLRLHDGVQTIRQWETSDEKRDSRVVQMLDQGFSAAWVLGRALFCLIATSCPYLPSTD